MHGARRVPQMAIAIVQARSLFGGNFSQWRVSNEIATPTRRYACFGCLATPVFVQFNLGSQFDFFAHASKSAKTEQLRDGRRHLRLTYAILR